MKQRTWLALFLGLSLAGATTLVADDDDDDEESEYEDDEHTAVSRPPSDVQADLRRLPAPQTAAFQEECGSCHMRYPPGLLPARSWAKLMAGLDKHFGENASLDPGVRNEITAFLLDHAADRSAGRRASKIAAAIPFGEAPLRFSETAYFKRKHDEISPAVFEREAIGSPAKCNACHTGAEQGDFNEERVNIPR